jgi:RimJ/RimL family protein N-acetyltransferase
VFRYASHLPVTFSLGHGDEMELIEITKDGMPACPISELPEVAADVMAGTAEMYKTTSYHPPWIGYLAILNGKCVGSCAFKTPPIEGRVEIAYFTFPENEGRGIATSMAKRLVEKAMSGSQGIRICAQTLPERNASTRVLEKLGFQKVAEVNHPEDGRVWEWELKAQQDAPADAEKPRR